MYRHEQSGRRWWWCHARHRKKGSHFINDQKGWWVSVALPFNNLFFSSSTFSCMETPHSLPPPQLLVVSHVAVMLLLLFITERLMLIFALPWLSVLCWLLFTSFSFHAPRPLLPLSLPLHRLRLICNVLFHAFFFFFFFYIHFDLPFPVSLPSLLPFPFPSPPPLSLLVFFNACDVCIGLLWCDQSSTPKFTRKIKTPAHTKTLHHDWLPATTYLALCLLLCVHPLACPALIGGCFFVPSLWLAVLMTNGVVHQNMGFLLTGITSVRSVSTKSKARVSPWGMTPPSLRREYHHIVSFMQRTTQDSLLHLRGPCVMLENHSFSLGYQIYLWIYEKLIRNIILFLFFLRRNASVLLSETQFNTLIWIGLLWMQWKTIVQVTSTKLRHENII